MDVAFCSPEHQNSEPVVEMATYLREVRPNPPVAWDWKTHHQQFVRPNGTFDHDAYAEQDWSQVPWKELWFLIEGDCVTSSWSAVQEVKRRIEWPMASDRH